VGYHGAVLFAVVNLLLALGFAAAAALQWNDPDPLRWMALYGGAAVACVVWRRVRRGWMVAALVGLVALVWAVMIALGLERMASPGELFSPMEMKGGPIEETRETLGLGLVAGWMLVLVIVEKRGDRTR
jgi:hypothetical protein